jgi:hypothetical protein
MADKCDSGARILGTYNSRDYDIPFFEAPKSGDCRRIPGETPRYVRPQGFPETVGFRITNRITSRAKGIEMGLIGFFPEATRSRF